MELPNVHDHHMKNPRKRKGRRSEKIKVVYISSPVKVKTSASRFRALVQELTGQDSDVSRFVESNGTTAYDPQQVVLDKGLSSAQDRVLESPTSSGSLFEPSFDDLLVNNSHGHGGFLGMFPSSNFLFGGEFDLGLGGYGTAV